MNEFIEVFGPITLSSIIPVIVACAFIYKIYSNYNKRVIDKYEEDKKREAQIQKLLEQVEQYPQWRKQSIEIQKKFIDDISVLKETANRNIERINEIEARNQERELNKLRDRLLQCYRYFTSIEHNPMQAWSEMEAESFWQMFKDYETDGGDGFMHTEVQPTMNLLTRIPMSETEQVAELMRSRK